MKYSKDYFDEENRPVKQIITKDGRKKYYTGPDAEGFIEQDEHGREYIEVDGERRYWQGEIRSIPDDKRLDRLQNFSFCFIKPDAADRGLRRDIVLEIDDMATIGSHLAFQFDPELVYRMYPYFFEESWEEALLKYLCSGTSLALLVFGDQVVDEMVALKDEIRKKHRKQELHPVVNLFHAADSRKDAIREALLLYETDELFRIAENHSGLT